MDKKQYRSFEFIYSLLMLLFGVGIILLFIIAVSYFIALLGIFILFYCWPILVGIWMGIFRENNDGYEVILKKKEAKKLNSIIDKITAKTGQNRPHKIIITENSGIAVSGLFRKKLIIGLGALRLLNEKDILAIIAHEYGHFYRKDTILGYFQYRIQEFFEIQKEINRANIGYNLFVVIFIPTYALFWLLSNLNALATLWYSRRIEYRADLFAAELVGKQTYANALVKYSCISVLFEHTIPEHIAYYLDQNQQIVNIYDYMKPVYKEQKNIYAAIKYELKANSSWFSTHPSISERLEALEIKEVDFEIKQNKSDLITNQVKYEEASSKIFTDKIAYLIHLSRQQEEQQ